MVCLSIVVDKQLPIIVNAVKEQLNFPLPYGDGPLGHGFAF